MKKLFMTFALLATSASAHAAQKTVLMGGLEQKRFGIGHFEDVARCSIEDRDKDGIKETTIVNIEIGKSVLSPIGILQNGLLTTEIVNDTNDTCGKITQLKKETMFGFIYGNVSSLLLLTAPGVLEERVSIVLDNRGPLPDGEPVLPEVRVALQETVIRKFQALEPGPSF